MGVIRLLRTVDGEITPTKVWTTNEHPEQSRPLVEVTVVPYVVLMANGFAKTGSTVVQEVVVGFGLGLELAQVVKILNPKSVKLVVVSILANAPK